MKTTVFAYVVLSFIALVCASSFLNCSSFNSAFGTASLSSSREARNGSRAASNTADVAVGAIRWDFWFRGNPTASRLTGAWSNRTPFFVWSDSLGNQVWDGDDKNTMDQEIGYARNAGISYFNFVYYGPTSIDNLDSVGSLSLNNYLQSRRNGEVNFSLMFSTGAAELQGLAGWSTTLNQWAEMIARPQYQTVLNGRPLVYFMGMDTWHDIFGTSSDPQGRASLDQLRKEIKTRTGQNPYFVLLDFYVHPTGNDPGAAALIANLGMDAYSSYASPLGNSGQQQPYSVCAAANKQYWENGRTNGLQTIPIVNTAWDPRPVAGNDPYVTRGSTPDYCDGTGVDVASNLSAAINWIHRYPQTSPASTVLVYAWDEIAEGGRLVPTREYGDSLLQGLRSVLRNIPTIPPKTNITGWVDSATYSAGRIQIAGWACGIGDSEPVVVDIYAGGPKGQGTLIGTQAANEISEATVQVNCQDSVGDAHRYAADLAAFRLIKFQQQPLYLYAHYLSSAASTLLNPNSPVVVPVITPDVPLINISAALAFALPGQVSQCAANTSCIYTGANDGQEAKVQCSSGTIAIRSVNFGVPWLQNESCLAYAQSLCNGQSSCNLTFSSGVCGGDPDVGVVKQASLVASCGTALHFKGPGGAIWDHLAQFNGDNSISASTTVLQTALIPATANFSAWVPAGTCVKSTQQALTVWKNMASTVEVTYCASSDGSSLSITHVAYIDGVFQGQVSHGSIYRP